MATPAASSVLLMLLVAFAAGANAATVTIVNQCSNTVWPAAIPDGGGYQLDQGQTWTLTDYRYGNGSIWGRTGCSFNGGRGSCLTGDCAGAFSCSVSGQPPVTLAEFTSDGATDYYDISVFYGFNVRMALLCGDSGSGLRCYDAKCPQAYPYDTNRHPCPGNSNYRVIFCPS